jgi:hypothetical protein
VTFPISPSSQGSGPPRLPGRFIPKSRATCAIGRPLSSVSRTPRSINSSGYFLALGIPEDSPSPRTKPRIRASVNAGLAQCGGAWCRERVAIGCLTVWAGRRIVAVT